MRVLVVAEGKHEHFGALENLLRKLGANDAVFEQERLSNSRIHAFHGKGQGYFKRAIRWLLEAQKHGFNALILLADEDGDQERVEQMDKAQTTTQWECPRALGIAIRTFDAWMLADETALSKALNCQVSRQPDPESLTDPKGRCKDLLANSPNDIAQSGMYAAVCQAADISILIQRCPRGFKPFAERVRSLFQ